MKENKLVIITCEKIKRQRQVTWTRFDLWSHITQKSFTDHSWFGTDSNFIQIFDCVKRNDAQGLDALYNPDILVIEEYEVRTRINYIIIFLLNFRLAFQYLRLPCNSRPIKSLIISSIK